MMCICGVLVGLAAYNNVLVTVPFPTVVYRKLLGLPLSLADLAQIEPDVALGLQKLLDCPATGSEVEDMLLAFEVTGQHICFIPAPHSEV